MNTAQIVKHQRDLLNTIAIDIAEVEQIAGGLLGLERRHIEINEKIGRIKEAITFATTDAHINAVILDGYKTDCLDSLLGLQRLIKMTMVAGEEDGRDEPSDQQLQHLAMAAGNYAARVENYLQLKAGMAREENNG